MSVGRDTYRQLDRAYVESEARDGRVKNDNINPDQPALARPRRWQQDNVSGNRPREPRVLLVKLTQKTSAQGRLYLTGWMGAARLVAFLTDEQDRDGNPVQVWNVYAAEPQPKEGLAVRARQRVYGSGR
jgi:hypothetical protein